MQTYGHDSMKCLGDDEPHIILLYAHIPVNIPLIRMESMQTVALTHTHTLKSYRMTLASLSSRAQCPIIIHQSDSLHIPIYCGGGGGLGGWAFANWVTLES